LTEHLAAIRTEVRACSRESRRATTRRLSAYHTRRGIERMNEPDEKPRMVMVYCTLCGNRKAKNMETGEEVDFIVGLTPEMIAEIRSDAKCVYCGSAMDIKFVEELDEGHT
jgi:hypothetical protein